MKVFVRASKNTRMKPQIKCSREERLQPFLCDQLYEAELIQAIQLKYDANLYAFIDYVKYEHINLKKTSMLVFKTV